MRHKKKKIKWFQVILALGLTIILIHGISAITLDRHIEYKKVSFNSVNLPIDMNGYRIAFVSDIHLMPSQKLEKVTDELNKLHPDLLILGGDFPNRIGEPHRTMENLSKVKTTDGIYGVEGNHDNYINLIEAMEQHNIIPLKNSAVCIQEHFYLAGVRDLWSRKADAEKAIEEAGDDDFILLVSHNPDITMIQDTASIDLILCGHTHGGQITFFGVWAPGLAFVTDYGQRFMAGWAKSRDGAPVYVSRGIGDYLIRVFARPQVILITLYAEGVEN